MDRMDELAVAMEEIQRALAKSQYRKGIAAQWEYRLPQMALRNTKILSQSRSGAKKYKVANEGIKGLLRNGNTGCHRWY